MESGFSCKALPSPDLRRIMIISSVMSSLISLSGFLSHPSIFRIPSAQSTLEGISSRFVYGPHRLTLAVVVRHHGLLHALAEAIISSQRACTSFEAVAIKVE